ncbi:MAG: choice-of-anchor Q domain-containing protein [Elainellaceae cyanobacterium]
MATFIVTNTNDSGNGSFRQAILDANAAAGADTIEFDTSLDQQTIDLSTGQLDITDSVSIDGDINNDGTPDITIDTKGTSRIFNIDDGDITVNQEVMIDGLVITGGQTVGRAEDGGGIRTVETLAIANSKILGNTTTGAVVEEGSIFRPGGDGGGIFNTGDLAIANSTISGNSTTGDDSTGGGIYNLGSLTITTSTIADNSTIGYQSDGGGIYSLGTLSISDSTISGNSATGSGSGGGGIVTNSYRAGANTISNSTISGNTAVVGGGIANYGGLTQIRNSTITNNQTFIGANSGVASLGETQTRTEVLSSIIVGNGNSDVDNFLPISDPPENTFVSLGNNLIGTGSAVASFNAPTDQTGITDAGLEPLSNNGGPTLTHALTSDSPAIDAGSNPDNLDTDQRGDGFDRVVGGQADIGAFERQQQTNTAPDAVDDRFSTAINKPLELASAALLENDSDADNNVLSITEVSNAINGTATLNDEGVVFTADPFFLGDASFDYTISDGQGGEDTATVSIQIALPDDAIRGTNRSETLTGTTQDDVLVARGGNDTLNGNEGNDTLLGGNGNDRANGGTGNDAIDGGKGNDRINGNGGNNFIRGGAGNDRINTGAQNDQVDGGSGNDIINDNGGTNTLLGGNGNDIIHSGSGDDLINGGVGNDMIQLGGGHDIVVLETGNGFDKIRNFQLGSTQFGVSSLEGLSFKGSGNGTTIFQGDDKLAMVNNVQKTTLEANLSAVFTTSF